MVGEASLKLSGEQFQEIIAHLVSDDQIKQHDKRHEPRVGIRAHGVVTPWTLDDDGAHQTPITIRDLSRGGISILSPTPMPKATRFILRLMRSQQTALLAHYEVRYSKPLAKSLFSIGAKLVNLSDASVAADAA
jgi:hypothetical protein